jgi:hypothetical protein
MPGPKRSKQKFPHEVVETVEDVGTQTLVETLPAETVRGRGAKLIARSDADPFEGPDLGGTGLYES